MAVQRIFIPSDQFHEDLTARITEQDHIHLTRVMRARVGDSVVLLNMTTLRAYRASLIEIGKSETLAQIEEETVVPPEPPVWLTVAQSLGKGDRFEQVIQHGTEAGASHFFPISPERCVVDIPANRVTERVARWNQIAKSAAEQSGRSRIPWVRRPGDWREFVRRSTPANIPCLLLHPDPPAIPMRRVLNRFESGSVKALDLLIGPEGGWSPDEVEFARKNGCELVSLGPRILRMETAALVAISQILYHFEDTGEP